MPQTPSIWDFISWASQNEGYTEPAPEGAPIEVGPDDGMEYPAGQYHNVGQSNQLQYLSELLESSYGNQKDLPADVTTTTPNYFNISTLGALGSEALAEAFGEEEFMSSVYDYPTSSTTSQGEMAEGDYYGLGYGGSANIEAAEGGDWSGMNYMSIGDLLGLTGEDTSWTGMEGDELSDYFSSLLSEEYGEGMRFDEEAIGRIGELASGLGVFTSPEKFGLGRKIQDVVGVGETKIGKAREKYIPQEIATRYGALQGKPGAEAAGEMYEQNLLSDIFGTERDVSRDVGGVYEDYHQSIMDNINTWLSYV